MTRATIQGQTFILHPFKGIFWEEEQCMLIADLHLGKAAHFRKAGIPVPPGVSDANWDRLISLLFDFKPGRVLFLGDLFHSVYNQSCEDFEQIIHQFSQISFELVKGNHDILQDRFYESANLKVYENSYRLGPFLFTHHPLDEVPSGQYNLAGHIHPSVRLMGQARQTLRLPCFYFGANKGILPAFGAFTGMATIRPKKGDEIYVIAQDEVLRV